MQFLINPHRVSNRCVIISFNIFTNTNTNVTSFLKIIIIIIILLIIIISSSSSNNIAEHCTDGEDADDDQMADDVDSGVVQVAEWRS